MNRSTVLLLIAALIAQPFIWIEHPLASLGGVAFGFLAVVMIISLIAGIALWSMDGK